MDVKWASWGRRDATYWAQLPIIHRNPAWLMCPSNSLLATNGYLSTLFGGIVYL